MRVDRSKTTLKRTADDGDSYMDASPAERVAFVWELTKDVWSLKNREDVERRLRRSITHLIRKGCDTRQAGTGLSSMVP